MITEKEAELIGMHVGDGTLYLVAKTPVWELRGSIYEKEFYEHVKRIINDLFGIEVNPKFRGTNSYGIQTTKKPITNFFINKGFKPGTKVYTVRIPDYIKSANRATKLSFVRGLFDTDGCIRFDKNRTPYHYYPKIEFGFASRLLSKDLILLLRALGFKSHNWKNFRKDGVDYRMCVAGFQNLKKWMDEVKPSNPKHITRIKEGLKNKSKVNIKS